MTSRRDRRANEAAKRRFRRQTQGNLLVHLFAAGERLEGRPHAGIISRAVADFYRSPAGLCCSCKQDYGRSAAAFAVAHAAVRPISAALLVVCHRCWSASGYLEALSTSIEATLQKKLLPQGRWLEPPPLPAHDTS